MRWKTKSRIQNAISKLPSTISYAVYYWMQRRFGALREMNPVVRLQAGVDIWQLIVRHGADPAGRVFLEVGTGRVPMTPLAYWLMGADETVTIDLNPYLEEELLRESLQYIFNNEADIRRLFGSLLKTDRFEALREHFDSPDFSALTFLQTCKITYKAPGDAARTLLPEQSVDFHTSHNVFEHIPQATLVEILKEGNRILSQDGFFVHRIDYSDHFSHSDGSISPINFLQYTAAEWQRYAGNRYMYMNRLRHDDFMQLYDKAGHNILLCDTETSAESLDLLRSGKLIPDSSFAAKPAETLAICSAWVVSRPASIESPRIPAEERRASCP